MVARFVNHRLIGGRQFEYIGIALGLGLAQQPLGQANGARRIVGDFRCNCPAGIDQLIVGHDL